MKYDNRQTHHKHTTNTPQTHHKHTTNTPQTHHKHTYTLNAIFILFLSPFTLVRLPKNLK